MTELRFEEKIIPSVDLSGESPLPAMRNALSFNLDYETGDEAGLFIGYGFSSACHSARLIFSVWVFVLLGFAAQLFISALRGYDFPDYACLLRGSVFVADCFKRSGFIFSERSMDGDCARVPNVGFLIRS